MLLLFAIFSIFVVLTILLIYWFSKLSYQQNWLDQPTDRGSHEIAIPHIGGMAIGICVLLSIAALVFRHYLSLANAFVWLFIVLTLTISGFVDDVKKLSPITRISLQLSIAIVVVWQVGGIQSLDLGVFKVEFGSLAILLGILWMIGFINMFNFMDGINGLAGCQSLIASIVFAAWLFVFNHIGLSIFFLSIAAISIGFLFWNFSPAKVFMGDAGSTMLGGIFATFCLYIHNEIGLSIVLPALVFAWFLSDSSITFCKRLIKKEKAWQAHRQHFYQCLAVHPTEHTKVTGMISLVTLIISVLITLFFII